MLRTKTFFYIILLSILAIALNNTPALLAQTVNGRLFTSFYTWERDVFGESPVKHFQTYNGAIFHIRQIGNQNLSFHTYFRFSNDLVSDAFTLQNKLYNSYVEWQRLFNRVDITVGRQFIWAGVGNGTVDGGKIEINLNGWGRIGAYIGTLAPLRESWKVDSWAESHMIGAYYKTRFLDTDMQLSWVRKNRKPVAYSVSGQYTGRKIEVSSLKGQLAGIDASRKFKDRLSLYLRAEGTILEQDEDRFDTERFTFDRFELSADLQAHKKLMITGQYFYRKPRENLNSIFSIFSNSNNREFWINVFYYPFQSISVFGGWAVVTYDDDSTNRYNLGLTSRYFTVNLNKFTGYSGSLDGFSGSAQYPLRDNLWTKAGISVGRYKLFEESTDYNNLVTSSLGFTYNPTPSVTVDIEGQGLRNNLSTSDVRMFGRINYWFFVRN